MKKQIELPENVIRDLYQNGDSDLQETLTDQLGDDFFNPKPEILRDEIEQMEETDKEKASTKAFVFLSKLCRKLNGDWTPSRGDRGYFIYSNYLWGLLFGGLAYNGSRAGFGSANANHAPSNTTANIGSRLCFRDEESAQYVIDNYGDYLKALFMVKQ